MKIAYTQKTMTQIVCLGLLIIGITQLHGNVIAQSSAAARTTAVVVTNSDLNPVSVQAAPNRTVQLLNVSGVEIPVDGKREWTIDVRGYSRIKVCSLGNGGFIAVLTDKPGLVITDLHSFDGVILALAGVYAQSQEDICRVIEFLPEPNIYVTAFGQGNAEPARGNVRVWAQ